MKNIKRGFITNDPWTIVRVLELWLSLNMISKLKNGLDKFRSITGSIKASND